MSFFDKMNEMLGLDRTKAEADAQKEEKRRKKAQDRADRQAAKEAIGAKTKKGDTEPSPASEGDEADDMLRDLENSSLEYFKDDGDDPRAIAAEEGFSISAPDQFKYLVPTTKEGVPIPFFGPVVLYYREADDEYITMWDFARTLMHPEKVEEYLRTPKTVVLCSIDEEGRSFYTGYPASLREKILQDWDEVEKAYAASYANYIRTLNKGKNGGKHKISGINDIPVDELNAILDGEGCKLQDLGDLSKKKLRKLYDKYFGAEAQSKQAKKQEPAGQQTAEETETETETAETVGTTDEADGSASDSDSVGEYEAVSTSLPLVIGDDNIYISTNLDNVDPEPELKLKTFDMYRLAILYGCVIKTCKQAKVISLPKEKTEDLIISVAELPQDVIDAKIPEIDKQIQENVLALNLPASNEEADADPNTGAEEKADTPST